MECTVKTRTFGECGARAEIDCSECSSAMCPSHTALDDRPTQKKPICTTCELAHSVSALTSIVHAAHRAAEQDMLGIVKLRLEDLIADAQSALSNLTLVEQTYVSKRRLEERPDRAADPLGDLCAVQ
jgi:hypothetical protein